MTSSMGNGTEPRGFGRRLSKLTSPSPLGEEGEVEDLDAAPAEAKDAVFVGGPEHLVGARTGRAGQGSHVVLCQGDCRQLAAG